MSSIASKNLYELLGNDPELDPDREPEPPTKAIDKPASRTGKRNVAPEAPASDSSRGGRGGRNNNYTGSEQAFRDRGAGSYQNRSKPADDGLRQDRHPDRLRGPDEHRDIGNRGRGSRGGRGYGGRGTRTGRDDRHSRTGIADHDKQAAHGWGGESGDAELADEKAGEAIAKQDGKEAFSPENPDADAEIAGDTEAFPEEPEDKQKSYADYLAEQTEKKLAIGDNLKTRKPNEGSSKKFPEGKEFSRDDDDEEYIAGSGGKAKRERARKERATVELDDSRFLSNPDRGGRGRGRGGRGPRGGGRGEYRGGRGRAAPAPNVLDKNAFPSLG